MTEAIRFHGRAHDARSLALQVLLDSGRHDGFVQELLDRHLTAETARGLSPADRRLATQLSYGVLRRRGTLRALLTPLVSRSPDNVEPWLWDALQLGAYQLALLTQVPAHAAIHETVELAARFGRPRAKGFLNAVLRSFSALVTPDRADGPAADALPLEGGAYRKLAQPVLPDPETSPVEYLACGFGLPGWLASRWLERFGRDEAFRLGSWFAGPASLTLRVNPLRTTREAFLAALTAAGWHAEPGVHPQAVRLREHAAVRELPGYQEGWFCVQDESAMRVASAVDPQPGWRVLDLCAAPGGKATHLAELMRDEGRIVACDIDPGRLKTVSELATRLRLKSVEADRQQTEVTEDGFDAALIDVPCGNTGVLGKRPEVRSRLRMEDIKHLVVVQRRLLKTAVERVKPGGVVVYSTCSIEPEENAGLVRGILSAHGGLRLEAEQESSPGCPADGGYWARLRKAS
ncbi:MAG: transcription antitermination factor NusB [Gemmataceae bacterium]